MTARPEYGRPRMTKLSDTQLVILSAAAQREDRNVLPLPGSLRGGAAAKVVGALLKRGLIAETATDSRDEGRRCAQPHLAQRRGRPRHPPAHHRRGPRRHRHRAGGRRQRAHGRRRGAERGGPAGRSRRGRPRAQGAHAAHGHQAGEADRDAPRRGRRDHRRDRRRPGGLHTRIRGVVGRAQEEARARRDLGEGGGPGPPLSLARGLNPRALRARPPAGGLDLVEGSASRRPRTPRPTMPGFTHHTRQACRSLCLRSEPYRQRRRIDRNTPAQQRAHAPSSLRQPRHDADAIMASALRPSRAVPPIPATPRPNRSLGDRDDGGAGRAPPGPGRNAEPLEQPPQQVAPQQRDDQE
jgi:hypothetical protein